MEQNETVPTIAVKRKRNVRATMQVDNELKLRFRRICLIERVKPYEQIELLMTQWIENRMKTLSEKRVDDVLLG